MIVCISRMKGTYIALEGKKYNKNLQRNQRSRYPSLSFNIKNYSISEWTIKSIFFDNPYVDAKS